MDRSTFVLLQARRVRTNYNRRLRRLNEKARNGDNEAALKIIRVLTEQAQALRKMGYRQTDAGKLVEITPQWVKEQKNKQTEIDRLTQRARDGDQQATVEFVRKLAEEE